MCVSCKKQLIDQQNHRHHPEETPRNTMKKLLLQATEQPLPKSRKALRRVGYLLLNRMGYRFSVLDPEVVLCGMDFKLEIVVVEGALVFNLSLLFCMYTIRQ